MYNIIVNIVIQNIKKIIYKSDESDESDDDVNTCFRCGREGHYSPSCYASTHINGYYLK